MNRAYIARAERRVRKIAKRKDLTTRDPLSAEIALAQLDAQIAIAQALVAMSKSDYSNIRTLLDALDFWRDRYFESRNDYRDLSREHAALKRKNAELRREARDGPWWRYLWPAS